MNKLLVGKNAITTKGRRIGPPKGAIPPARTVKIAKSIKMSGKLSKAEEALQWKEEELKRRNSMKWKDMKHDRNDDVFTTM